MQSLSHKKEQMRPEVARMLRLREEPERLLSSCVARRHMQVLKACEVQYDSRQWNRMPESALRL